ncbi:unnamed protein product [Brachionus calyciflorus]|uniref:Helitron helicase-like domain-containing protein n=1 Tax=Brachionus calyciflorus TaxID=104777 RepID=A0A813ZYR3_9BILA|nr:unnamed protein product [Brachionus calyciflorus]
MQQLFLDAMAIVGHNGKQDLFITFTCNPDLADIKNELEPNQIANDRPDIIVRDFSYYVWGLIAFMPDLNGFQYNEELISDIERELKLI